MWNTVVSYMFRTAQSPLPQSSLLTVIGGFLLSNVSPAKVEKVEGFVGVASPAILKLQQTTVKLLPLRH